MSRACGCSTCFYCDGPIPRHEHDHAPIPQRAGGTDVVTACIPCHHLKDRMPASVWFPSALVAAARDLASLPATADWSAWPAWWDEASTEARIMWAKVAAGVAEGHAAPDSL